VAGFLKFLVGLLPWLVRLIQGAERVKLEREQEQLADAYRKDMEEIDKDSRSVDDALARLRMRNRTAKRDRGVPKVPGRS
jgi:hypothetical protein